MNIVFVSREYGSITGGGIGTYIENATRALAELGHQIFLVADWFEKVPKKEHLPFQPVPTLPCPHDATDQFFSWMHEYSYRVFLTLQQLTSEKHIDVIEFADYLGEGFITIQSKRTTGAFSDIRLVVKCHTPSDLIHEINDVHTITTELTVNSFLEQYCIRQADILCSPTQALAEWVATHYKTSIPSISRYPHYSSCIDTPRQHLPKSVVFAGTIQPRKGIDTFIKSAILLLEHEPEFLFHIAGPDSKSGLFGRSYAEQLKRSIPANLLDRFQWHGKLDNNALHSLYSQCLFAVFPSRWENYPNVCLEAMSCGCIVIGGNQGGMPEIIEDEISGFLVTPTDEQAIKHKILKCLNNLSEAAAIQKNAVLRISTIANPTKAAEEIINGYQSPTRYKWRTRTPSPLVSIVIPLYNQGEYLPETLNSIHASLYNRIEIIIVNDGSTDQETLNLFDSIQGVTKVTKVNGGLGSARNAGIAHANGTYILPLDADDLIEPEAIGSAVVALENRPELSYVGFFTKHFGITDSVYPACGYIVPTTLIINTEGSCTKLFRASALQKVGGYDETLPAYEDWDLVNRLNSSGFLGDVIPLPLFRYRRRDNSMNYVDGFRRAGTLLQYLHAKIVPQMPRVQVERLLRLLTERLKTTELSREEQYRALTKTINILRGEVIDESIAQVFWTKNADFAEEDSLRLPSPLDQWVKLTFEVPTDEWKSFRIDPTYHKSTVYIHSLRAYDTNRLRVLDLGANAQKDLPMACGDAEWATEVWPLQLACTGNDPQIILPNRPGFLSVRSLEVVMMIRPNRAPVLHLSARHKISIKAIGKANNTAKGCEVWLTEISSDVDVVELSDCSIVEGAWEIRTDASLPMRCVAIAHSSLPASIEAAIAGSNLCIAFYQNAWSGLVIIDIDGRSQTVDLYSEEPRIKRIKVHI